MTTWRDRGGRGGLGCLGSLVLLGVLGYLAVQFLPPWMHYEQFRDSMRSEARYATTVADSTIRIRLIAQADSLGLPPEARRILIRRRLGRPPTITISTEYTEQVALPIFGIKLLHFRPSVVESL